MIEFCAGKPQRKGPPRSRAVWNSPHQSEWGPNTHTPKASQAPGPPCSPAREGPCRRQAFGELKELCGTALCPTAVRIHSHARGGRGPPLSAVAASSGLSTSSFASTLPFPRRCARPLPSALLRACFPGGFPAGAELTEAPRPLFPRGCRGPLP